MNTGLVAIGPAFDPHEEAELVKLFIAATTGLRIRTIPKIKHMPDKRAYCTK